ncbi:hypothetical protein GCM10010230_35280 [Streptomyces narbonensis]|nr:hypothetical protein GCM10010230_35280 [Streptomyces narbonensis]
MATPSRPHPDPAPAPSRPHPDPVPTPPGPVPAPPRPRPGPTPAPSRPHPDPVPTLTPVRGDSTQRRSGRPLSSDLRRTPVRDLGPIRRARSASSVES